MTKALHDFFLKRITIFIGGKLQFNTLKLFAGSRFKGRLDLELKYFMLLSIDVGNSSI